MTPLGSFPRPYREAYGAYEALRRLGFEPDDIFVGFGPVSNLRDVLHVQLQAQGKVFTISVGCLPGERYDDVMAAWQHFAELVPRARESELQACWHECWISHPPGSFDLVASLVNKGFVLPRSDDRMAVGQA